MGRYCERNVGPVLEAATQWRNQCLLGDGSLLSDDRIWTLEHLAEMTQYFVENPDVGDDKFIDKLRKQLVEANPGTKQIAAELMWLLLLFPSNIKPGTKTEIVSEIWSWSGSEPLKDDHPLLTFEVLGGIGSGGMGFNTNRWRELAYAISVVTEFKKLEPARQKSLLADPWEWAAWLENLPGSDARQFRHMVCYLLFPDDFERISSGNDKFSLLKAFVGTTRAQYNQMSWTEVDQTLHKVRRDKEDEYGTTELDFYHAPLREFWSRPGEKRGDDVEGGSRGPKPVPSPSTRARYWVFAPGENARLWPDMVSGNFMAMGWDDLGDLSEFETKEDIRKKLVEVYNYETSGSNDAKACYDFAFAISVGDYILVKNGVRRIIAVGRVDSEYRFEPTRNEYKHVRSATWLDQTELELPDGIQLAQKTLTPLPPDSEIVKLTTGYIGLEVPQPSFVAEEGVQYWWLNANPKIWDIIAPPVGTRQTYTARNSKGNKRRVYKYFEQVKPGDLMLGYVASPLCQVAALCEVTKELHETDEGEAFEFKKIEKYSSPVSYRELQDTPGLEGCEPLNNNQGSLFRLTADEFETIKGILDERVGDDVEVVAPYSEEEALKDLFMSEEQLNEMLGILRYKKNVVLQGPPGVGKTFVAKRIAYLMMGQKDSSRVETIQFHQSFSYEDFIQGIRPDSKGRFGLKDGVFHRFCVKAALDKDRPYVFVIDEINRGNLSKIFGEVMMLVEADKRGEEITLANCDSGETFTIPENVYIIGTMNTADRSLAFVDYALRRRFCFVNIPSAFGGEIASGKFGDYLRQQGAKDGVVDLILKKMEVLNEKIREDKKDLGPGYEIGHSYFCYDDSGKYDHEWYRKIIRFEVGPLLREYWFDNTDKADSHIESLLDV